jgi:hypothetical protein
MSDSIKRRIPGGNFVTTAKAYCDGWRRYAEPVAAMTGWSIHSFAKDIKFVSPDYKHTQSMSIEFIEALFPVIRPKAHKCSNCNVPCSFVVSPTHPKRVESPLPSTGQSTPTSTTTKDSSDPGASSSQ